MRLKTSACLAALAALILSACQKASTPEARGQAYFNALGCRQCHQIGSEGGSYGPNLTFVGFRKNTLWLHTWLKNPHAWRRQTVMPNFNLNEETRSALVAYLSAQKGQAWDAGGRPWNRPEAAQDPLKRGEMIFNLAGCVACHSQKGAGGYPNNNVVGGKIPALSKVAEGYSKEELEKKIAGGVTPAPADPSAPPPMIFMPKWSEVLKSDEISAVADYLISLAPKKAGSSEW